MKIAIHSEGKNRTEKNKGVSELYSDQLLNAAKHLAEGELGKAEALLRPYVYDNPDDVNGIRMLGELGLALGALGDAQDLLARAVELAPDYDVARYALANTFYKRHNYTEANVQIEKLLSIQPDNPNYLLLKAATLVEVSEHKGAIEIYEKILDQRKDYRQAYLSYGHALRAIGENTRAISAYEYCIEGSDGAGDAYFSLANLKTYEFSENQIAHMESLLQDSACAYRDYYHLLFALGKAREDRGEHKAAMAAYVKGNQVRGKSVPWDVDRFSQDSRELRDLFTADFFQCRQGMGSQANDPIFIVGLPRAGSTLIEQILASHSQVEGTAELADIIAMARKISGKKRRADESNYPRALVHMNADQLSELGASYLQSTAIQRVTDKPFFIDKMPNNFSHIGLIQLILPNAKIIDARRHPLDCCFSGYKQLFASGQGFTYGQERIGRYYRDYLAMMEHWDTVLPGRVLRVHYENMVSDTERQVHRLLDYCGLPFEKACLEFHKTQRTVRTASSEQVRQPIYQRGMNQWQPFEQWLGPLKNVLGTALTHYDELLTEN